jgi:hypothetical protein
MISFPPQLLLVSSTPDLGNALRAGLKTASEALIASTAARVELAFRTASSARHLPMVNAVA